MLLVPPLARLKTKMVHDARVGFLVSEAVSWSMNGAFFLVSHGKRRFQTMNWYQAKG